MGPVPHKHQIDRIDNNLGYTPHNCRWVTSKTNNRNRRNNRVFTFNGKTQCVAAWAEEYHMSYSKLYGRICLNGMSMKKALEVDHSK
jgi:hypothetical protein